MTTWNRKAVMILACILAITVMVVSFLFNAPRAQSASAAEEVRRRSWATTPRGVATSPRRRDTGAALAPGGLAGAGTLPADLPVDVYGSGAVAGMDAAGLGAVVPVRDRRTPRTPPAMEAAPPAPAAPAAPAPPDPRDVSRPPPADGRRGW